MSDGNEKLQKSQYEEKIYLTTDIALVALLAVHPGCASLA